MKLCSKCRNPENSEFHKDRRKKDGLSGWCTVCVKNKTLEYRQKNAKRIHDYQLSHPEIFRSAHLRKKYGMTIEEYEEKFKKQNGRCAICNRHQNELVKTLSVDHDHSTGKIRDLLCDHCNRGLGYAKEDINTLNKMVDYLQKWKK